MQSQNVNNGYNESSEQKRSVNQADFHSRVVGNDRVKFTLFAISEKLKTKKWDEALNLLDSLRSIICPNQNPLNNKSIEAALNSNLSNSGATLLAAAVTYGAPTALVDQLLTWGANPHGVISAKINGARDTHLSLLHLAFGNNRFHLVPLLLQVGVASGSISSNGYDPLTLYFETHTPSSTVEKKLGYILDLMQMSGTRIDFRSPSGKTLPQYLSAVKHFESLERVLGYFSKEQDTPQKSGYKRGEIHPLAVETFAADISEPLRTAILQHLSKIPIIAEGEKTQSDAELSLLSQKLSEVIWRRFEGRPRHTHQKDSEFGNFVQQLIQFKALFSEELLSTALSMERKEGSWSRTILWQSVHNRVDADTIRRILSLGADPNQKSRVGIPYIDGPEFRVPLDEALKLQSLETAELLLESGANSKEVADPALFKHAVDFSLYAVPTVANMNPSLGAIEPFEKVKRMVQYPLLFKQFYGAEKLEKIIESEFKLLRPYLQFKLVREIDKAKFLTPLLPQGDDAYLKDSIERIIAHASETKKGLGISFSEVPQSEVLVRLCKSGALAEAIVLLKLRIPIPPIFVKGASDSAQSPENQEALRQDLIKDATKLFKSFYPREEVPETVEDVIEFSRRSSSNKSKEKIRPLLESILWVDGDIRLTVKILNVLIELKSGVTPGKTQKEKNLVEVLPQLLYRYPLSIFTSLLYMIEYGGDRIRRNSYTHLPELFASLHHPEVVNILKNNLVDQFAGASLHTITAALSSLTSMSNYGVEVNGSAINAWRAIANITHGHRRYRYETKRVYGVSDDGKKRVELPSMFEVFGAKRLPEITEKDPFHSGYVFYGRAYKKRGQLDSPAMRHLDDKTVIVRYRGGEVIFHPDIGYLFIRNSSLVFGRDLLPGPAYFTPIAGVMEVEGGLLKAPETGGMQRATARSPHECLRIIQSLKPDTILNSSIPIMEPLLYPIVDRRDDGYVVRPKRENKPDGRRPGIDLISELLQKRERFESGWREFIFNTDYKSAWKEDRDGNEQLVGAFMSKGFKEQLTRLHATLEEAQYEAMISGEPFIPPQALELYDPSTLPISPYARLELTQEVISLLEKLSVEGWPSQSKNQQDEQIDEVEFEDEESEQEYVEKSELEEAGVYALISTALKNQAEMIIVPNERKM